MYFVFFDVYLLLLITKVEYIIFLKSKGLLKPSVVSRIAGDEMTTLLRKDWESISSRTNFSSSSPLSSDRQQQQLMVAYAESSAGPFDRIPFDIFMQILKIRKFVVSDNCLWINFLQNQHESWDSIFYAESHLRLGYPLQ